jgi:hypothetical protein
MEFKEEEKNLLGGFKNQVVLSGSINQTVETLTFTSQVSLLLHSQGPPDAPVVLSVKTNCHHHFNRINILEYCNLIFAFFFFWVNFYSLLAMAPYHKSPNHLLLITVHRSNHSVTSQLDVAHTATYRKSP